MNISRNRLLIMFGLVYILTIPLVGAIFYRYSHYGECIQVKNDPHQTTGMVVSQACNHRGNCLLRYHFDRHGAPYFSEQVDTEHHFRPGDSILVTYSEAPSFKAVGGDLDARIATERYSFVLGMVVLPPAIALVLTMIVAFFLQDRWQRAQDPFREKKGADQSVSDTDS